MATKHCSLQACRHHGYPMRMLYNWMSPTIFTFCALVLKSLKSEIKKMDIWIFSTIKVSYNPFNNA